MHIHEITVAVCADRCIEDLVVVVGIYVTMTVRTVLGLDLLYVHVVNRAVVAFLTLWDCDIKRLAMTVFAGHQILLQLLLVKRVRISGVTLRTVHILSLQCDRAKLHLSVN